MGALRATVSIRGREIEILFSHIEFSRKTDKKCRPVTSVIGGKLTFSIEATKDTAVSYTHLAYWIQMILKRNIVLPEYQRTFVWNKDDYTNLIDSFKEKQFIPPVIIGAYKTANGQDNLMIDGQQRLTSVLLAYIERFPQKEAGAGNIESLFAHIEFSRKTDKKGRPVTSEMCIRDRYNTLFIVYKRKHCPCRRNPLNDSSHLHIIYGSYALKVLSIYP